MNNFMAKASSILSRIVATFLTSALGIIGGAAVLGGISIYKSALLAGFAACAQVIERLAKASLDGVLTFEEINEAFLPTKKTGEK